MVAEPCPFTFAMDPACPSSPVPVTRRLTDSRERIQGHSPEEDHVGLLVVRELTVYPAEGTGYPVLHADTVEDRADTAPQLRHLAMPRRGRTARLPSGTFRRPAATAGTEVTP